MPKGYAEGPAAEEAERRRDELASGVPETSHATRVAIEGCTAESDERHFLGWADEVDADELFASGTAWGIRLVRRTVGSVPAGDRPRATGAPEGRHRG